MTRNLDSAQASSAAQSPLGKCHPAFEFLRSETISSLDIRVEEYRHRETGAQHVHLVADNSENVFLVALRTVPEDSTGVAHMLEHTVLCGSERYPVRDPFFMMIRRSLNTFMNAFTSSDWTAYPFASKNRKDFLNLMDVYLDAVFFSRLDELDFCQEGHRVEFEKADDPSTNLVFKGVVFNEMKGAMSSPVSALWHRLSAHLFPTTTYHYNSGGDPECIPDLSYAGLKQFYKSHYHPSNAVFLTFGDISAAEHQQQFEEKALSRFQRLAHEITVADEKRYTKPVVVQETYALDEGEDSGDKTHIVLAWLLGHSTNLKEQMYAHLLSGVLMDNSASPLRHALETSDLGSAPSPLCGLEESNREMSFVCGIEGSRPEHAEAVEKLIFSVLQEVADNGVAQDKVESVLHQLELHQREIGGDGYPFGLQLALEVLSASVHRGDPVAALNLDPVLEEMRAAIQNPDFIKNLVTDLLLNNMHRVRFTMVPDNNLRLQREKAEADRLAAIKNDMSEEQIRQTVELAEKLKERQMQEDDVEILPKVSSEDIPRDLSIPEPVVHPSKGKPTTVFAQGTNGLVYQQILVALPSLSEELLDYMPQYSGCLAELGSGGRDYLSTQARQDQISGGINIYNSIRGHIDDVQQVTGYCVISSKALQRNHEQLCELLRETIESPRFDELARIRELIAQRRARAEQNITGSGHVLVMCAASSGMSPASALEHRLRGLAGIDRLKQLDNGLEDNAKVEQLAQKFEVLHQQIWAGEKQFLLVGDAEHNAAYSDELLKTWPPAKQEPAKGAISLSAVREQVRQVWTTSTDVNFCAKAYPAVPIAHPDAAALMVLGGFLRNGFLHRAVREQGGAYGGGASYDSDAACFRFFSYRDPRLTETLEDFDKSIHWLAENRHVQRQLEEAILGVIGSIDKPSSPAGEAKKAFHAELFGRSAAHRRRFREQILDVSLEDLCRVGETYLKPETASVAVLTNADQFAAAPMLADMDYHKL